MAAGRPMLNSPFFCKSPHHHHRLKSTPHGISVSIPQSPHQQPKLTSIKFSAVDNPNPSSSSSVTLKSRLAAGEILYGMFLLSSSPTLAEIAGLAGYDYVVIDMEHGPGGIHDSLHLLRALGATRTPAVIRIPELSAAWAKKALDLGPQGIMFPSVESPRAAELAVSFTRYPPRGVRGAAHPVVRASGYGVDDGYLARCEDDELLVAVQAETVAGVSEIGGIAAVDGVDVVQMGPLDLSASLGFLWDPGNRKVRAALRKAEEEVLLAAANRRRKQGPWLAGFATPGDKPEELKARGYHMVAGAVDVGMFRQAAVDDVARFRRAEVEIGEEDDVDGARKPSSTDESYWSE